jgi:hypothetical protein
MKDFKELAEAIGLVSESNEKKELKKAWNVIKMILTISQATKDLTPDTLKKFEEAIKVVEKNLKL